MEIDNYYYNLNDIFNKVNARTFYDWNSYKDGIKPTTLEILSNLMIDGVDTLVNPLLMRWQGNRVYLIISDEEIDFTNGFTRDKTIMPILVKLNNILGIKIRENEWLNNFLSKDTISNEQTSTSINRHNDTPTSVGDYSADKYTSDINQTTNTTSNSLNDLEMYQVRMNALHNIQQEIINEMKEFEIWM